jgi:hypothetical protein
MLAELVKEEGTLGNKEYFALKITKDGVTRTLRISAHEYGEDGELEKTVTELLLLDVVHNVNYR